MGRHYDQLDLDERYGINTLGLHLRIGNMSTVFQSEILDF